MRIGVVPRLERYIGGGYQYSVTMLERLCELETGDDFAVFTYGGQSVPEGIALPRPAVPLRRASGVLGAIAARLASALRPANVVDPAWTRFFASHGIDMLLFTTESDLATNSGVPYIVAIHDIQHRLHPEFPEVSADGEWELREERIRRLIAGALVVLVDSETGKQDVLDHYSDTGIDPEAVRPLPFLPPDYLAEVDLEPDDLARIRQEYELPEAYLFCPAQFWPHKNHKRVIEAIGMLAEEGLRVPLVLAGSHTGDLRERTFAEAMRTAEELGVRDLVLYLGYVPDEVMPALYAGAHALVFPTFFGPTNIPVLEAFAFSCPVITSDIRGIREQVGDAGLLVDPESVDAIASAVRKVVTEPVLSAALGQRGRERLLSYTREDYLRLLTEAIGEASRRLAERAGRK